MRAKTSGFRRVTARLALMSLMTAVHARAVGADDELPPSRSDKRACSGAGPETATMPAAGTLGYGPPGLHPGFQGFGLGYRLGYGYGGSGLGVGADGGYPFYAGPGYPHEAPRLRRFGRTNMFPFFAGPGYPTPGFPNYYAPVGPLVSEKPVISTPEQPGEAPVGEGYGGYSGGIPDAEARFARSTLAPASFATAPATAGELHGATVKADKTDEPGVLNQTLAMDSAAVVDGDGAKAVMVVNVKRGGLAEKAGLETGDVIRSINGRLMQMPTHLDWAVDHVGADKTLTLSVRKLKDGKITSIAIVLP